MNRLPPLLILSIMSLFALIFSSPSYGDATLIACPKNLPASEYSLPLMQSELDKIKQYPPTSGSSMMGCRGYFPYAGSAYTTVIRYDLYVAKLGANDTRDFTYEGYYDTKTVQIDPFGNGNIYKAGTPFGGRSHPHLILRDITGSCEIKIDAGISSGIGWQREGPENGLRTEYAKAASELLDQLKKEVQRIEFDISADAELSRYCHDTPKASPTPKPPSTTLTEPVSPIAAFNTWVNDTFGMTSIEDISKESARRPVITEETQEDLIPPPALTASTYFVGIINNLGENSALVKNPGTDDFKELSTGDVPPGSIISSRDEQIIISVGVGKELIVIEPDSEFVVPGDANSNLQNGTIEIKTDEPTELHTDIVDLIVIGTHFWVSHNSQLRQTTIGVFDGTVQVMPRGTQASTMVSPSADNPRVIIVSQKISPIKLLISALVAITIIAVVIWFQKKFPKKNKANRR